MGIRRTGRHSQQRPKTPTFLLFRCPVFGCSFPAQEESKISTGAIKLAQSTTKLKFVAAFALESVVEIRGSMVEPIMFEYRVDPGGDPVDLAVVAFSHHGDDWNMLI